MCDNQIAGIIDFFDFSHCRGPPENRYISYTDASHYRRWISDQLTRFDANLDFEPSSQSNIATFSAFSLILSTFIVLKF